MLLYQYNVVNQHGMEISKLLFFSNKCPNSKHSYKVVLNPIPKYAKSSIKHGLFIHKTQFFSISRNTIH